MKRPVANPLVRPLKMSIALSTCLIKSSAVKYLLRFFPALKTSRASPSEGELSLQLHIINLFAGQKIELTDRPKPNAPTRTSRSLKSSVTAPRPYVLGQAYHFCVSISTFADHTRRMWIHHVSLTSA